VIDMTRVRKYPPKIRAPQWNELIDDYVSQTDTGGQSIPTLDNLTIQEVEVITSSRVLQNVTISASLLVSGTVTDLITFDRDPSSPFAVSTGSAVVPNLDSDMLDGVHYSEISSEIDSDIATHAALTSGVHGVGSGHIVGTTISQTLTNKALGSGVEFIASPSGQSYLDHGSISGLADDDHVQYVHVSSPRTITALHLFDRDPEAPFSVSSGSGKVTNLDADLIDGQHRILKINADHTHQSSGAEGGQLDHGLALTGLSDDDHTQYVHVSTPRTITALHTFDRDPDPPFAVTSGSGLVANLNADLWDGYEFSDYLDQGVRTSDSPTFNGLTLNNTLDLSDNEIANAVLNNPEIKDVDSTPVGNVLLKATDQILRVRASGDSAYAGLDPLNLYVGGTEVINSSRQLIGLASVQQDLTLGDSYKVQWSDVGWYRSGSGAIKTDGKVIASDGGLEVPASYIIYKSGSEYRARNGLTGEIEFSGTDAATVIQQAIDGLTDGGIIFISTGIYPIETSIAIKNNIHIIGEGWGIYPWNTKVTVLQKSANIDLITVDGTAEDHVEGFSLENLQLDGQEGTYVGKGVKISYGYYFVIEKCWIRDFADSCVHISNSGLHWITKNKIGRSGGHVLYYDSTGDFVVENNDIGVITDLTNYDEDAIYLIDSSGRIENNKIFLGRYGIEAVSSNIVAVGNVFNDLWYGGVFTSGGGSVIVGNRFFRVNQMNSTDALASGICVHTTKCVVVGNQINGGPDAYMRYGVYETSAGNYNLFANNVIEHYAVEGIRIYGSDSKARNNIGYITENSGTTTFSGDGTTTNFTIAHGCASTPTVVSLEAKSADAVGDKYWSADDTNITVTFITPPPIGTDNVVIGWKAEV